MSKKTILKLKTFVGICSFIIIAIFGLNIIMCSLFTTNLPDIAGDLISGGYTSLKCDPTKLIQPQRAGCDPDDQVAIECTAMTKTGEAVTVLLCTEIRIERE